MIQICGLNPFAEAMLYFLGKANNNGVKKRFDEAVSMYPEYKKELETVAKSAKAIEKQLDKELSYDETAVKKFFANFQGAEVYSPFGFCLASVVLQLQVMANLNQPLDITVKHLRECPHDQIIYSFCVTIADKNELIPDDSSLNDEFLFYLEKLPISAEDKLKIISAAFAYNKTLEELLSIILPAARIIEKSHEKYDEVIKNFTEKYSCDKVRSLVNSNFVDKLPYFENMEVVPSLLGFDSRFAVFYAEELDKFYNLQTENEISSDKIKPAAAGANVDHPFACIFVGVLRHLIGHASQNDIPAICDKIKALSDTTRLEMLFYLCSHKPYAQELGEKFGLSHSAVSYHITKLSAAGFVTAEISGGKTYYEADTESIQRMLDYFGAKIRHKSNPG